MSFSDDHAPSIFFKLMLSIALLAGVLVSTVLTSGVMPELNEYMNYPHNGGDFNRQVVMLVCGLLYVTRFILAMFVFVQRKIGRFEGSFVSVLFFMMFYLFGISAGSHPEPMSFIDYLGVVVYLIGSTINVLADFQRWSFIRDTGNKGKLFTRGLFKRAMHINYFGDSIAYLGLAMLTHFLPCYLIVLGISLNFAFLQIPALDRHLKNKYGNDFVQYSQKTSKRIPYVY